MRKLCAFDHFRSLAAAVLLAGFAVRLALGTYHGLEGDDGFSLALSRFDTPTLVAGLMEMRLDIHPPLHFLALKGWAATAGDSLIALRLMNTLADLLTGALIIRLAGRSAGRRAGLAAGVLWVAAPLLIYAGWLLRMYTLLALFCAGGAVCAVEASRAQGERHAVWSAGAALCALAAMYTHIYGLLVLGALALALLADAVRRPRRLRRLTAAWTPLALAALAYLPYAGALWTVYRSGRALGATTNAVTFTGPLDVIGTVFAVALTHRAGSAAFGLVALAMLGIAGVWLWRRSPRQTPDVPILFAVLFAGACVLAGLFDLYKPRYLTPLVPPLLALLGGVVAAGVQARMRLALLLAGLGLSLAGLNADFDRTRRDDFAAAAAYVETHERASDTILVVPDWGQEAFKYHYDGTAPVTGIFPQVTLDLDLAPILDSLVGGYDGVWLVSYQPEVSDAGGLVPAWLAARAPLTTEVFPSGMRVRHYDLAPTRRTLDAVARPLDAQFGGQLGLRGVWLPQTHGSARDTRLHPPSAWVYVVLYWEALRPSPAAVPRVRFTDGTGQVWGAALELGDSLTARTPVAEWQPGVIWRAAYNLNINPAAPPGVYNIEVMVLDPASGEPLAASGTDAGAFWSIAGQFHIE